jgi:zinc transport system substrate-binding protein
MKIFRITLGVAFVMTAIVIAFLKLSIPVTSSTKLHVVTTIFPLYDFAKNIGGDKIEVSLLLPPGVEAHSFEPKPNDMVKINQSDIFIYTGKFMEPWAEDIVKGISGRDVVVVNASKDITRIKQIHKNDSIDPHIWLDFDNDKMIIENISNAFSKKDPSNASYYQQKAEEYQNKLSLLDIKFKTSLSLCKSNEIVYGGHYAFGYLADRYHLQYFAAQGVSPDSEPTAQDLVQLVQQIQKDKIQYVFYEELSSPKIAETLAHETNVKLLLLNAAHNIAKQDFESGVSFSSIMEKNLKNLQIGLGCEKVGTHPTMSSR